MKAITIWQPYASLVAENFKKIETRGWQTHYRGKLAIHAAKKTFKEADFLDNLLELQSAANQKPDEAQAVIDWYHRNCKSGLQTGAIIAVGHLEAVIPTEDLTDEGLLCPVEYALGGYGPERFGWCLSNIKKLENPVITNGKQGIWNVSPSLAAQTLKQLLSRDAQIVAQSLFGLGQNSSVTFQTPARITPRTSIAINELINAGMVVRDMDWHKSIRVFKGTENIGNPRRDFKPVEESEDFAIVKGDAA